MEQQPLFFEDVHDALRHVVHASGGAKAVGSLLFPNLDDPAMAGRRLMDCLNPERPEKLDVLQIIQLLRIGHQHGCHVAMHYLSERSGYSRPEPVEPEDTRAALQREFISAVGKLNNLASRLGVNVTTGNKS